MRKQTLFTRTRISLVVASILAASAPAFADDASQIDQMQGQIKALEQQIEAMKSSVDKHDESIQAMNSRLEEVSSAVSNPSKAIRGEPSGKGVMYGKVNVQLGGFAASETVYRSQGLQSDIGSPFSKIPFNVPTSTTAAGSHTYAGPVFGNSEFRGTERQSRFSMLATGMANDDTVLSAYYELDFLAAATTANPNESNSFSPRTRHVYANIDWQNEGLHMLAGQTWSLATLNTQGITPRNEYIPLSIDAQYVPGFTWARQWQFRLVKDWDKKYWAAVSFENSQTAGVSGVAPKGATNNFAMVPPGGSLFNPVTAGGAAGPAGMSINRYPDIVAKFAVETDLGHYEVYDLMRNFDSNYQSPGVGNMTQQNTWANAVGAGAVIPVLPKMLDFSVSGLSGKGIGRYGTSGLADATYDVNGALLPTKETMFLTGLTLHAAPTMDVYANYGREQLDSTTSGNGSSMIGYGDGFGAAGTVNGLKSVAQATTGFWWSFYKGNYGAFKLGMQYSHTQLSSFENVTGTTMHTSDNMVFTSLRYFPF